jgi:hypothetical protein
MKQTVVIVAALAWLTAGCGGVSTMVNWDEAYSFTDLGTYEWVEQDPPPGFDSVTVNLVRSTTEDVLGAKGYRKDPESPSFLVAFQMGTQEQLSPRLYSNPYIRTGYMEASTQTRLIIDVVDPEERAAVWSGSAGISVNPQDTHKNAPPIRKAVQKLLDEFPPES